MHIEVDESHHISIEEKDKLRANEIIFATNHRFERIIFETSHDLLKVDKQIDILVKEIYSEVKSRKQKNNWKTWDFKKYSDPQVYYLEKGFLNVDENPTFRIGAQIANLLG